MFGQQVLVVDEVEGVQLVDLLHHQLVLGREVSDRVVDRLQVYSIVHQLGLDLLSLNHHPQHLCLPVREHVEFNQHDPEK